MRSLLRYYVHCCGVTNRRHQSDNPLCVYLCHLSAAAFRLGVLHTFQGGCSPLPNAGGDFVADTPAVRAPNMVCKKTDSCPTLFGDDLVNNFMVRKST
jgi:hypothetical protein